MGDIFDRDRVNIIPIASFEAHEFDAEGNPIFRRVSMKFPNETAFTDSVIELAKMTGWLVHHDRLKQNVQGHAGFPDLCLVRAGRVIFAELKLDGNEPTEEQQKWLDAALLPLHDIERVSSIPGYEVMVRAVCWTPSMWDLVVKTLTTFGRGSR